jgi:hypothetical protein
MAVKLPGILSLAVLFLAYAAGIGFFTALHFLNRRALRASAGGRIGVLWGAGVAQSPGA